MCGKMASPDVAVELDRRESTLLSGHCVCIFHRECASILPNFACRRCRAIGNGIQSVTMRNCLRCGVYARDALCVCCFEFLCNVMATNMRLADQSVDIEDSCRSFLAPGSSSKSLAWIFLQLHNCASQLKFILVEEHGTFVARSRAWALVELWRKMLLAQPWIRFNEWTGDVKSLSILGPNIGSARAMVLRQALELLPSRAMLIENGLIQMQKKRPTLTDDGYFALGRTLCSSGLFEFYDERRISGQVGRYFVGSKNDFVYYNDRAILHQMNDPAFREQWQTNAFAICVKDAEKVNEESN